MPTPATLHMIVERIVGQVCLPANEPAERGRRPLEHAIPFAQPGQLLCRSSPEFLRVLPGLLNPTIHNWTDQFHRYVCLPSSYLKSPRFMSKEENRYGTASKAIPLTLQFYHNSTS